MKGKLPTRNVRLILIELRNGPGIEATRVRNNLSGMGEYSFHYPEKYRLEVLARALDGCVRQYETGLEQRGLTGRNVMLVTNGDPQGEKVCGLAMPRIVLVDYDIARRFLIYQQMWPCRCPETQLYGFCATIFGFNLPVGCQ